MGRKVRQTIQELGGTMPEDLTTPEKSVKQIEREVERKKLKGNKTVDEELFGNSNQFPMIKTEVEECIKTNMRKP